MALTRDDIVTAALAVLDDGGADRLTVRRIAERLGVKAPALYWHVPSKQDLVDEIATELHRRALGPLGDAAPPGRRWRPELEAAAGRLRAVLCAHTDGARVYSGSRLTDIELVRAGEQRLRMLVEAGFTPREAALAVAALRDLVVGFVIEEQAVFTPDGAVRAGYTAAARAAAVGDGYPLTAASGPADWGPADRRFADAVRFLLDGMAARLRERGISDP